MAETVGATRFVMTGVRKAFGATVALDGVDLAVRAGEVCALVGQTGAGKHTFGDRRLGRADRIFEVDVAHLDLGNFGDSEATAIQDRQQGAMAKMAGRLQQRLHFLAAQNQRQLLLAPGKPDAFHRDFPAQRVGVEEPQCADHLD